LTKRCDPKIKSFDATIDYYKDLAITSDDLRFMYSPFERKTVLGRLTNTLNGMVGGSYTKVRKDYADNF